MPSTFEYKWDTPKYKGQTSFNTGLFIGGQFVDGSRGTTIDVINPTTGKLITTISEGTEEDVNAAVAAAQKAFDTVWGLKVGGLERSQHLWNLAQAMERHKDELAALDSLDNDERKLIYTRHEPIGVVGQIIPWNFPLLMWAWKIAPALATGNTIVLKPSEVTPLSAIRMCGIIKEAGIPDGVVNIVTGYGHTVGAAISSHMKIDKVAFTGSTLVGRKVMEAAAKSNLKTVTLELGGKSPNIIYDDADLEQAVNWAAHGIFWNHGQACCAGSRIFVQAGIYDQFMEKFVAKARSIKLGDPFGADTEQGPQVSQIQYDRIMGYINSGKEQGATVVTGGDRNGSEGYFINPTIFTDVKPNMKIVKEEIFGPVGVVIKFTDEDDVIRQANDTVYGLAAAVFTQNINRAIETAHRLQAGTAWINCVNQVHAQVPFGGYKQSGIGREMGEYALSHYTNVKAVHINLQHKK
ncbi:hypothetical protein D9613_010211 [Agrocybe pediades]|uniref:Aldehyde dehydrogenase domain-containing protein n=1 Tax=Agrocybe pediades TaxID=84607 RepID=A0A8H4QG19_9AGAR|nr:hypothetical protein D9613_010211 [Agrocybe pediades]